MSMIRFGWGQDCDVSSPSSPPAAAAAAASAASASEAPSSPIRDHETAFPGSPFASPIKRVKRDREEAEEEEKALAAMEPLRLPHTRASLAINPDGELVDTEPYVFAKFDGSLRIDLSPHVFEGILCLVPPPAGASPSSFPEYKFARATDAVRSLRLGDLYNGRADPPAMWTITKSLVPIFTMPMEDKIVCPISPYVSHTLTLDDAMHQLHSYLHNTLATLEQARELVQCAYTTARTCSRQQLVAAVKHQAYVMDRVFIEDDDSAGPPVVVDHQLTLYDYYFPANAANNGVSHCVVHGIDTLKRTIDLIPFFWPIGC